MPTLTWKGFTEGKICDRLCTTCPSKRTTKIGRQKFVNRWQRIKQVNACAVVGRTTPV